MATDQQFCLRWNNHQSTLISVFDSLLENGTLVDCTLAAEGQYLKAHKVVLSACSPYLETLLSQHYEKHPIVILKDVKFTELKSMMDYMYRGEVNISQDQLGTFLKAAESLQIKGLSDNGDEATTGPTTKRQEASSRPSVTEVRNVESKRPAPSADLSDASREGSISPSSLRKRRRTRRTSQGDDPDSHLDTSNACDFPINTSQTTSLSVPSTTVVPTPVQNLPKQIVKQEPSISRIDNLNSTIPPESGLLKEKIEPPSEPLLEPKTEYLDYMNNENSIEVEDLTLDDDEELDSSMDASRPGPSHGDLSNQGYQWPMSGDQSGTDEIFMAAQQAVGAATGQQRDSQDDHQLKEEIYDLQLKEEIEEHDEESLEDHDFMLSSDSELQPLVYMCTLCNEQFRSHTLFLHHSCVEIAHAEALGRTEVKTDETIITYANEGDYEVESEIQVVSESVISLESSFPPSESNDCLSVEIVEEEPSLLEHDATLEDWEEDLYENSDMSQDPTCQGSNSDSTLKIKKKYPTIRKCFLCSECGKLCKGKYKLTHHNCGPIPNPIVRGSLGKPPYKCICGSVMIHKTSFSRHVHHECKLRKERENNVNERYKFIKSLGRPPFECNSCGSVVKSKHSYYDHVQSCGTPKTQQCPHCNNKFNTYKGMRTHVRKYHAICTLCKGEFKTKVDLEEHQNNEHMRCYFCSELYKNRDDLDNHVHNTHLNI